MKKHDMLSGLLLALMTLFTLSASAQPDKNYLCFTANKGGSTVALSKTEGQTEVSLEYSTDDGKSWLAYTIGTAVTLNEVGDKVYFRNVGTAGTFSTNNVSYNRFEMTGSIAASGNVMSLVDQNCATTTIPCDYCFYKLFQSCTALTAAPELPATELAAYCYSDMFRGCTALTTAPELPATTMKDNCYYYMFEGCTDLKTAPKLPATKLAKQCYSYMFNGCTALTTAPELNATTLANECCSNMFNGCTSLTKAPELNATTLAEKCYSRMFLDCKKLTEVPKKLPATDLASQCYSQMFQGCDSLKTAPELPATKLETGCYCQMFYGCKSLVTAPELPATKLASQCYMAMFYGCTSLMTAPELPATTLATYCYAQMFNGCSALTTAPELPATTLANQCYYNMFNGCSALTTAPELPATTLEVSCYNSMFKGCSALTTAPELPATTLANQCYSNMFNGCKELNDIKVAFTDWDVTGATTNWVTSVPATGTLTFTCPKDLDTTTPGESKNPTSWKTQNTYDVTGTAIGWTSLCVNLPLTVPTGAEVYYASAVEGSTITLTPIAAGITMAARTAVIVKADESTTLQFAVAGTDGMAYDSNLFQGSSVAKSRTEDVYVLSGASESGSPQFQNYVGTTLGTHKIWLPKSALGGATGAIQFRFADATAIDAVATADAHAVTYNLLGQPVPADYRGIVIRNGKKIYNK